MNAIAQPSTNARSTTGPTTIYRAIGDKLAREGTGWEVLTTSPDSADAVRNVDMWLYNRQKGVAFGIELSYFRTGNPNAAVIQREWFGTYPDGSLYLRPDKYNAFLRALDPALRKCRCFYLGRHYIAA